MRPWSLFSQFLERIPKNRISSDIAAYLLMIECSLCEEKGMKDMGLKAFFLGKNSKYLESDALMAVLKVKPLPRHVAVIMDGNGRWAQKHHLPRIAGHRQGVEALREIIKVTSELDIEYLTLYAFSTENWKRPQTEVNGLMSLLVEYLQKEVKTLLENGVRIRVLGDITALPADARKEVSSAVRRTQHNQKLKVNIAINYGSRIEIIRAIKSLIQDVESGLVKSNAIDEALLAGYLDTHDIPDPDLLIRTSGEYRLSNFLLYQLAYTELYFTENDLFWPDFNRSVYLRILKEYQNRQRRYGGLHTGKDG